MSTKAQHSLKIIERRWLLDFAREAQQPDNLDKLKEGMLEQLSKMYESAISRATKVKRVPSKPYLLAIKRLRDKTIRRHSALKKIAQGIYQTKSKIYEGLNAEQCAERDLQIARIPLDQFKDFCKIPADQREDRLLALIKEYGAGSKNGGFAPALLNQPGIYHNPYVLNESHESDGTKRRPQFIHELIERLINACLYPEQFKQIFFQRTKKVVKKWGHNWRQIRSEGRFAMMRVLLVLLPYLDFKATLRMGIPDKDSKNGYSGLSRKVIAKRAGISLDSVKTALKSLVEQGLIHQGKQPREEYTKEDGSVGYKGLPVVRTVTQNFIVRLGLGKRWVERERKAQGRNGAITLPKELKTALEQIEYARLHPEEFSAKEMAFLEMAVDLL